MCLISNDLTQMFNCPTRITDCNFHSSAILNLFLSSDASICFALLFPPLGNSDHAVVSVSIDFPSKSNQDAPFHCTAHSSLFDHLRDVPWEETLRLVLLLLLVHFVSGLRLESMFIFFM